jgi:hypothetical protein
MEHLEEHPHAFLTGNVVINVAVFAEHDEELIDLICQANDGEQSLCCCNLGMVPRTGWTWDGTTFIELVTENTDGM